MGHREMAVGDSIVFMKERCSPPTRSKGEKCETKQVGTGKVVELVDEHDSIVALEGDSALPSGAVAERPEELREQQHRH